MSAISATQNKNFNTTAAAHAIVGCIAAQGLASIVTKIFYGVFMPQNPGKVFTVMAALLLVGGIQTRVILTDKEKKEGLTLVERERLNTNPAMIVAAVSMIAGRALSSYLGLRFLPSFALTTTVSAICTGIAFRNQELGFGSNPV